MPGAKSRLRTNTRRSMPPPVSSSPAPVPESSPMITRLDDWIHVAEIGAAGTAATPAAWLLGLYRVDLLMGVFFSMTPAGPFPSALLAQLAPVPQATVRPFPLWLEFQHPF